MIRIRFLRDFVNTNAVTATNLSVVSQRLRSSISLSPISAMSWTAIFAGAIAALALILPILETRLRLSTDSSWAPNEIIAGFFDVPAIVWLIVTQLLAPGLGGYQAGGMRTEWKSVRNNEVHFRHTTLGFFAWTVAALETAVMLASATVAAVSSGVRTGAAVSGTAVAGGIGAVAAASDRERAGIAPPDSGNYFMGSLPRKELANFLESTSARAGSFSGSTVDSAAEVSRMFTSSPRTGALLPEDIGYVNQIAEQRTSMSQADAKKRVSETSARMQSRLREAEILGREGADKPRTAFDYAALWVFISLPIGAFLARSAATIGGRQRESQNQYSTAL